MALSAELRQAFDNEEDALEVFEANEEKARLHDIIRRVGVANQACDPERYTRIEALVREAGRA